MRKGNYRKPKNKIIIAVEGNNKTEKLYFNNFDDGKKSYSITIARGNDTDPLNLVMNLSKEIKRLRLNLKSGDKAYCVFDIDVNPTRNKMIHSTIEFAKTKGIEVITSTPSIELWFLLHYEYTTSVLSNREVIRRLRKWIPHYEKNVDIYADIEDKTDTAIKNALKLERFQIENGHMLQTVEANPSTDIYKIVEYLLECNN